MSAAGGAPAPGALQSGRQVASLLAASFPFQILLVLGAYRLLRGPLFESATLSPEAYETASPFWSLLHHPTSLAWALGPTLVLLVSRRPLRWEDIDPGRRTRVVILMGAAVLAWTMITLGYNFYYDQLYPVDRLVMLALLVASWWTPVVVPLLASSLLIFGSQVNHPLPAAAWIWVDKQLPVEWVLLATALLLVRRLLGQMRPWVPLFAFLSMTGATYWNAGVSKLDFGPTPLSWLLENETSNLLLSTYLAIDFLGWLELDTIVAWTRRLRHFDLVLGVFTLVVELGGLLILVRRRVTIAVLLGFITLHLGIVATSGIFFWKWILLDLSSLWCLFGLRKDGALEVEPPPARALDAAFPAGSSLRRWLYPRSPYALPAVVLGLLLIAGRMWWPMVPFAWWDSRYLNFFPIYGVDETGERHRLTGEFFAPYDILIHQSRFYSAMHEPRLTDTTGTTYEVELYRRLRTATFDDVEAIREEFSRYKHRPGDERRVREFFRRFVANAQTTPPPAARVLLALAPPFHFRHTVPEDHWTGSPPLVEVVLVFEEHFFDGRRSELLYAEDVIRIPLQEELSDPGGTRPDETGS